jgi:hypothetical protein
MEERVRADDKVLAQDPTGRLGSRYLYLYFAGADWVAPSLPANFPIRYLLALPEAAVAGSNYLPRYGFTCESDGGAKADAKLIPLHGGRRARC